MGLNSIPVPGFSRSENPTDHRLPPLLRGISTPLKADAWQVALYRHPDREYVGWILRGILKGFRIGSEVVKSAKRNMVSTYEPPSVVADYLEKERSEDRVMGPFSLEFSRLNQIHISRFGIIPSIKKSQPGKWRLIVDLSAPDGASVNDGIVPSLCSLSYTSVDDTAAEVLQLGKGALLAKLDIQHAYRIVPLHPDDRICWVCHGKGDL